MGTWDNMENVALKEMLTREKFKKQDLTLFQLCLDYNDEGVGW
jgi:hypothetical protein